MICNNEPFLIEYNIRMGDPECQVLMMRLETDLLEIIEYATTDRLKELKIKWSKDYSLTVVMCAKGYPGDYIKNSELKNLNRIISNKYNQIFHAGTYEKNNKVFSNGGRVLNVASTGKKLINAQKNALENLKKIDWNDGFFRKDIGWRAIKKNENN